MEALAQTLVGEFGRHGVETQLVRVVDLNVLPGVSSDEGDGGEWPRIHELLDRADILVMASPTWVGRHSSVAQRVLERMDAMISETQDNGLPVAYNKVAGVVVTGNEDWRPPRHQRDLGRAHRHRLHHPGPELDVLEQAARPG